MSLSGVDCAATRPPLIATRAASAKAASHDVVDDLVGLIALSATALLLLSCKSTPRRRYPPPKPVNEINGRSDPFDPGGMAKSRPHRQIARAAAALRRHAMCGAGAHDNIIN
ncbi:hypothetical protein [Bradyrhizobium hipponense]|uniref:hypothetical protein n=1 Tax=Bradyrhizobium hipponense TaxID=2605638 RepID=UPI0016531A26|nr:hypothetical protein [Bradyrhizobium hipponense]